MKMTSCLQRFFGYYLTRIKGVSVNTIQVHKKSFELFLPFVAGYRECVVKNVLVEHISTELVVDFLVDLEVSRNNDVRTRNLRPASLKSLAKMIRLLYPELREYGDCILLIPQKRAQKKLIGYLYQEEILSILSKIDLKKKDGMRDYAILNLLLDAGARASEIAGLELDYFDYQNKTIALLGKGNRYRQVSLWPKTVDLLVRYIEQHRRQPKFGHDHCLFINQRGKRFTRHGVYRICRKYLEAVLPRKRLDVLNPVHSFRHSCAMNMLTAGSSITEIRNRLGHENINSTMVYLKMEVRQKREVQKKFVQYTQSLLTDDNQIEELTTWKTDREILAWLDSL
jgi:site-specific recombinase XerD